MQYTICEAITSDLFKVLFLSMCSMYLFHGIKNVLTHFVVTGIYKFNSFVLVGRIYFVRTKLSMDVPIFNPEVVDVVDRIFLPPISR